VEIEKEKLKTIVLSLLAAKREGEFWDFKENFHTNRADLLHDILCMANNLANHDAYIIFGVEDRTFAIKGITSDSNRRDQKYYVTFLKDKKFAGGIRPETKLLTIQVESKELDVLIIRNTTKTPYYLLESFKDQDREVKANSIYTRIGDNSIDMNIFEKSLRRVYLRFPI
jgi:predicted HTH transcriptional regulator